MNIAGNAALPRARDAADDAVVAAELANEAGTLLLAHRETLCTGADPDTIRKQGDALSHQFLTGRLAERFPHDVVLSEEGIDDRARLTSDRVWVIDPLDGTKEFGEIGRTDWAVHVALVANGNLVAGAVTLPSLGVTYSSGSDRPEYQHFSPPCPRVAVSRTRRPEPVLRLAEALDAELVEMGSAGAKAMAVVRGDADIYAHTGGQYEWDSAAPVAVARAAGLHVSRIDGSPLIYNQENPWLPDLLICRPEWADRALEVLTR